ncbi:MAG: NifB/NifX family molybdenum-iron cluster-binding protein [Aristaeellaceae bacterium]
MKLAVTYADGQVFQHFGHTAHFKLYDIQDGQITHSEVVSAEGSGHGALADFLQARGVTAVICGGIGGGARLALAKAGILIYGGVQGGADEAAQAWLNHRLAYDPHARCTHHEEEHGHTCGHTCGQ